VVVAYGDDVGSGGEALGGVRVDRVEHPKPRRAVGVPPEDEQVLGDEAVERIEAGLRNRFCHLHCRAAGEDGESCETLPFGVGEEVVAPVDSRAQRPLADGGVTGADAQRTECVVKTLGDLIG
jgi:hypothetical protein